MFDRFIPSAAIAILLLAACSGEPADPAPAPTPAPADPAPPASDVAPIQLSALTPQDIEAASLGGELGCSFSSDTGSLLLVAMGVVASKTPAQGVIKVSNTAVRLAAPGGFDGMLRGAEFSGAGQTVRIAVTGPATGGGESPPSPATLTYQPATGASLTVAGDWTCGP